MATVHCILLPDLTPKGLYKSPRVELLARRWEERCLELRQGAQALLLRELSRMGPSGRKQLIDEWSPFLPTLVDASVSILGSNLVAASASQAVLPSSLPNPSSEDAQPQSGGTRESTPLTSTAGWDPVLIQGDKFDGTFNQPSVQQLRRNQATAVVLLGVIGAEYGQEIAQVANVSSRPQAPDGFGNNDYSLARATSKLFYFSKKFY